MTRTSLQKKRHANAMWLHWALAAIDDRAAHQMKLQADAADRRTEKRKGARSGAGRPQKQEG